MTEVVATPEINERKFPNRLVDLYDNLRTAISRIGKGDIFVNGKPVKIEVISKSGKNIDLLHPNPRLVEFSNVDLNYYWADSITLEQLQERELVKKSKREKGKFARPRFAHFAEENHIDNERLKTLKLLDDCWPTGIKIQEKAFTPDDIFTKTEEEIFEKYQEAVNAFTLAKVNREKKTPEELESLDHQRKKLHDLGAQVVKETLVRILENPEISNEAARRVFEGLYLIWLDSEADKIVLRPPREILPKSIRTDQSEFLTKIKNKLKRKFPTFRFEIQGEWSGIHDPYMMEDVRYYMTIGFAGRSIKDRVISRNVLDFLVSEGIVEKPTTAG